MPLTPEQIRQLKQAAKAEGVDFASLLRTAQGMVDGQDPAAAAGAQPQAPVMPGQAPPGVDGAQAGAGEAADPAAEKLIQNAKLYEYHLPFVFVREIRKTFLGLTDPFPGDNEVASDWVRSHPSTAAPPPQFGGDGGDNQDAKSVTQKTGGLFGGNANKQPQDNAGAKKLPGNLPPSGADKAKG